MRSQAYDDLAFLAHRRPSIRKMTASKNLHGLDRAVWISVPVGSSMIRWHMLLGIGELEAFRVAVTIGRRTNSRRLISLAASFCISVDDVDGTTATSVRRLVGPSCFTTAIPRPL